MSFTVPSRRLASRCFFCSRTSTFHPKSSLLLQPQRRHASSDDDSQPNPIRDKWLREQALNPQTVQNPHDPTDPRNRPTPGDLGSSSIFAQERQETELLLQQQEQQQAAEAQQNAPPPKIRIGGVDRDPVKLARVLDLEPAARVRYQRKKVIQLVRRGGRLSKEQVLKRTEREITVRSHEMKTSVKKLGMLARQIAGKTVEDAITQMRFSKKKAAVEVLKQLQAARDEGVVARGMGVGSLGGEEGEGEKREIQLKDGKRHVVGNPNTIYIDQAWVGRGTFGQQLDHRARGRVFIMRTPFTSLSVKLKEERTRIREWEEREQKRKKKLAQNVWTHLPDRPVQWQRQWYTF